MSIPIQRYSSAQMLTSYDEPKAPKASPAKSLIRESMYCFELERECALRKEGWKKMYIEEDVVTFIRKNPINHQRERRYLWKKSEMTITHCAYNKYLIFTSNGVFEAFGDATFEDVT